MRFKLDENLPVEVLEDLRAAGHEGDSVHDEGLAGEPDTEILAAAKREGRVLLTLDKGIGDIRTHRPEEYPGIVLFRPASSGRRAALEFIQKHLPRVLELDLAGHLTVVTGTGIRTR